MENVTNLDFDVTDFIRSTQNRPAHHRWKYMRWKIASGIATLHKLKNKVRIKEIKSDLTGIDKRIIIE